jgi:1,4-dihydroxy-2-naphthoyl-CoA hydrolase
MSAEQAAGTLQERMGMEFLEVGAERTVARIPVEGNTQPYGLLHGGASAALAETVGSVAAAVHAGADRIAVGVDLSATHHRAVRAGWVTGVATPLSRGRSVASYEIVVRDDEGSRVCTARLTCMLRDRPPGA